MTNPLVAFGDRASGCNLAGRATGSLTAWPTVVRSTGARPATRCRS